MKVVIKYTAAPEYLFKTTDNSCLLSLTEKDEFHTITAKILWLSQRTRPDVQLSVGFYWTKIQASIYHDWKKLTHLLSYLWTIRFIPLIIINDEKRLLFTLMVHTNCKGRSGLFVTQGKGAMIIFSKKLGLVTNSSTETEIVTTGKRLPKCTWFRHFRIEHGEPVREYVLMQDNKNCMLLQKNGQFSVGKGSKHIHIRYFFATYKFDKWELKLIYCPTGKMIADFCTKPLQGAIVVEFRNKMQGIQVEDFRKYKRHYVEILKQYDLYENEDDLFNI